MDNQIIAADPNYSVWVRASAGTGKTKVLIDRILRLLISGVEPRKILAITFTKAAANEMVERIFARLAAWSYLTAEALKLELESMLGRPAHRQEINIAINLFNQLINDINSLRIQTIHSFCSNILQYFAVEAGISQFSLIEEHKLQELITEAKINILTDGELNEAIEYINLKLHKNIFDKLIDDIINDKSKINELLELYDYDHHAMLVKLYNILNIKYEQNEQQLIEQFINYNYEQYLPQFMLMFEGGKTDISNAHDIITWVKLIKAQKFAAINDYLRVFLTIKGDPVKNLLSKKLSEKYPELISLLKQEQDRVLAFMENKNTIICANLTKYFLQIACNFMINLNHLKTKQSLIDYDDLITHTRRLLKNSDNSQWILYKLDGGIDHILVDEAQDTNIAQWEIIQAISEEFFAGNGSIDYNRTLFVVGDEKQSIYSFQGANPQDFLLIQKYFKHKINNAQKSFKIISLEKSFRSCYAILDLIDKIFNQEQIRHHVDIDNQVINHLVHRQESKGIVEIWPLIEDEVSKEEGEEGFYLPNKREIIQNNADILANKIAKTIKNWLDDQRYIEAKNRPIQPGDIMILVRTRNEFSKLLLRQLKNYNIPVAGMDRQQLKDDLAVQDLIALGNFILLPDDDLNLAGLLKSPILGLDENQLMELCLKKGDNSLWQELQSKEEEHYKFVVNYLTHLLLTDKNYSPFTLYNYILNDDIRQKFLDRLGQESLDLLDEFLFLCFKYENDNIPSLQGFIYFIEKNNVEIKREISNSNQVKILTIHGSKGLQAPIIFLPDTTTKSKVDNTILWHESMLIWPGRQSYCNRLAHKIRRRNIDKEESEYFRLLYVALTRAEDELYISGYKNNDKIAENCWYNVIKNIINTSVDNKQISAKFEDI